jgi:hypothetical protein
MRPNSIFNGAEHLVKCSGFISKSTGPLHANHIQEIKEKAGITVRRLKRIKIFSLVHFSINFK